jgi:hypothetical protein
MGQGGLGDDLVTEAGGDERRSARTPVIRDPCFLEYEDVGIE